MAATANMILKISTMADLAGLKAGLDMIANLGAKVAEAIKEVDEFSDAHSRLSLNVSKMIESTRGMIAAQDAYVTANKLSAAGINATAAELEGLGKRAVEYAQATGQDIPAALAQMTSAVIAGSERGLRQFGVDLQGSTDKLANAHAALGQFSEQMRGTEITVDSMSDSIEALGNNASDAGKRIAELAGISGALASPLNAINSALSSFNTLMEGAPDKAAAFFNVLKGTGVEAIRGLLGALQTALTPLEMIADVFGSLWQLAAKFVGLGDINPVSALKRGIETLRAELSDVSSGLAGELSKAASGGSVSGTAQAQQSAWSQAISGATAAAGRGGRGRGGGGGGRSVGTASMEFTEEELYGESDASIVDRRMADMKAMSDYDQSDIDELTGITMKPPTTPEASRDAVDAMSEWLDARAMQMETEIGYAESFERAWSSSLKNVSSGSIAAAGAQNMLRGAVTMVATAAVNGGKITVRAITDMVKGVALAIGIESTLRAVMELALGLGKVASSYGADPTAEIHFAAALQHGITAGLAFAVAGGASAIGNAAGGSGGRSGQAAASGTGTGQGQYGSPGYSSVGGQQQQNVVIVLEGDAGGVFRVVDDENRKRSYSGQSSFAAA